MRSFAIVAFLLFLLPTVGAATPVANRSVADHTDGQDITDLAADPTGQFVAAVVAFDPSKSSPGGGLLGGTPASSTKKDVYLCNYGTPERPNSGSCRGIRHQVGALETYTPNAAQRVDATFVDSNGRQGVYLVAGPDNRLTLWNHDSDTPLWSTSLSGGLLPWNVTLAPDASRAIVGVAPATGGGAVEARFGNNGTIIWSLPLINAAGAAVRPTSLDWSRGASVLAIGTTDGVLLANPAGPVPTGALSGISQAVGVTRVQLSTNGEWLAASGKDGVFFVKVVGGARPTTTGNSTIFNRGTGGVPAQDVAISGDGSRFAAAAGSKIHFFSRIENGAEPSGSFDAGATVSSIAYDDKGALLVAVAGNNVLGFGPGRTTPLWTFDASQTAFGSVDGPLRKVFVSDDAQRIVVAGKTKTMSYTGVLGATASIASTTGATAIAPTQTASLTLTVKNTGSLMDNYSFVVTTPVGWQPASADDIRLAPDEVGTVKFNVTAPVGQEPGVYGVQVRVRSQVADDLAQRRNQPSSYISGPAFNLTIPRSVVLNLTAPDDRLLLRQGGEQIVPITIRNEGNAEGVVNLSTRQEPTRGASWTIAFDGGDQVRVPASATINVNMLVTAPSDAGSGDRNIITIRAREGDTVEATDQVTAYVNPQFGAELKTNRTSWEFFPGQVQTVRMNVTNIGNTEDVFNLTQSVTPASVASDWRVTLETEQITILRGQTKPVLVTIKAVASDAREASVVLKAISQSSPDRQEGSLTLSLLTIPRPPTQDDDDDRLLPGPGPALLALLLVGLALARRGGRR